ncbi:DUF349 domain-containing protein [Microbacterium sp. zg.Y909]|uniref:DUF349 domain-containing protein n=2 Tax=Microbacterium TaxID=33882 RepID=UPI0027E3129D|nr:DUF349 domain-containing protein [Microbacterium sp. zg.Y909]
MNAAAEPTPDMPETDTPATGDEVDAVTQPNDAPDTGAAETTTDAGDSLEEPTAPVESTESTEPADQPAETPEPAESTESTEPADQPAETPEPAESTEQPAETPEPAESTEQPAETPAAAESTEQPAETPAQPAVSTESAEPAAPVAAPAPAPAPGPRPPMPRAPQAAVKPVLPPAAPSASWGRVDDDGTVFVREGDDWRAVGQYPDGTPAEALAYFERKYTDLVSEVTLLEVRHRRGGASAADLRSAVALVRDKVNGAMAVGDLASLSARVEALDAELATASESEVAAAREAVEQAIAHRTSLVEQAEALAARDPKSVQWKQATSDMTSLFDQWQAHQQNGPRLPKSTAQQLWKRFRDARGTVDKHRREFYAELDETHKAARDRKTRLVERAEALAPRGEDGIAAYRDLLDEWKSSGRAGKKVDDALWARFKAAGDALYGARAERENADAEASKEKIEARRALLVEAAAVPDEKDIAKARQLLTGIQRRWDELGRIFPRDVERSLDDDLRKIEQALSTREQTDWKRNNPETKARANDMTRQLNDAIEKLESELEAARAAGDSRAEAAANEALAARKAWLSALGG